MSIKKLLDNNSAFMIYIHMSYKIHSYLQKGIHLIQSQIKKCLVWQGLMVEYPS